MLLVALILVANPESNASEPRRSVDLVVSIDLPGEYGDIVLGGTGRFVCIHIVDQNKISVIDVVEKKEIGSVAVTDSEIAFCATRTDLVLVEKTSKQIKRYRLLDQKLELAKDLEWLSTVHTVGSGCGSDGPILMTLSDSAKSDVANEKSFKLQLVDLKTFQNRFAGDAIKPRSSNNRGNGGALRRRDWPDPFINLFF